MHGGGVDGGEAIVKSSLPKVITLGYTELNLTLTLTLTLALTLTRLSPSATPSST